MRRRSARPRAKDSHDPQEMTDHAPKIDPGGSVALWRPYLRAECEETARAIAMHIIDPEPIGCISRSLLSTLRSLGFDRTSGRRSLGVSESLGTVVLWNPGRHSIERASKSLVRGGAMLAVISRDRERIDRDLCSQGFEFLGHIGYNRFIYARG